MFPAQSKKDKTLFFFLGELQLLMSTNKKNMLKSILGSDFGCGCGKMSLPDVVQPQPIPPLVPSLDSHKSNSTSSASREDRTSATFSLHVGSSQNCSESEIDPTPTAVDVTPRTESQRLPSSSGVGGSIAVVKESDHPYRDFRDSMLRMILEKRIYSKDDLEDLLRCFLELNSPCYHGVIIQAFAEIWQNVVPNRLIGKSRD